MYESKKRTVLMHIYSNMKLEQTTIMMEVNISPAKTNVLQRI